MPERALFRRKLSRPPEEFLRLDPVGSEQPIVTQGELSEGVFRIGFGRLPEQLACGGAVGIDATAQIQERRIRGFVLEKTIVSGNELPEITAVVVDPLISAMPFNRHRAIRQ